MQTHILETEIELEKLKDFFAILPITAIGGLLAIVIASIGLINAVPFTYILAWLGLALLIFVFKITLIKSFRKNKKYVRNLQLLIILVFFLSGISWGFAGFVYYKIVPDSYHIYIVTMVIAASAAYFPILMHYDKCFYAFFPTSILPIVYTLATANIPGGQNIAFMLLIYLCFMLGFSKWFYARELERVRLQHTMYQQNKQVKEANESKSRFLASASHDLRQPLQALGFYIVMLSDFLREPNKKALFDKALRAYQALEDLLNQLLNVSKLNANLVEIENTHFSIEELFEKLKNDYELQAIDKDLTIDFITEEHFAYSDVVSVERIMRNLVENALRYTERGNIHVSCQTNNNKLIFEVSDTGIGISNEHIGKIFDEFYQIKNPERDRSKGFGLGLYAVNRLTKLLDTTIEVKSITGKGSDFSFVLPVGSKPHVTESISPDRLEKNCVLFEKIILIVDDDTVVLDSIYRLFLSWKCQVLTADSYQQAIKLINDEEIIPELLVMDYRLPNYQTGVKLTKDIHTRIGQSIPTVILTGDTGEESLTDINNSGLPFLHKPTDPKKLKKIAIELLC